MKKKITFIFVIMFLACITILASYIKKENDNYMESYDYISKNVEKKLELTDIKKIIESKDVEKIYNYAKAYEYIYDFKNAKSLLLSLIPINNGKIERLELQLAKIYCETGEFDKAEDLAIETTGYIPKKPIVANDVNRNDVFLHNVLLEVYLIEDLKKAEQLAFDLYKHYNKNGKQSTEYIYNCYKAIKKLRTIKPCNDYILRYLEIINEYVGSARLKFHGYQNLINSCKTIKENNLIKTITQSEEYKSTVEETNEYKN